MTTRESARVLNLTFHGIGDLLRPLDDGEASVWLSEKRFAEFVEAARDRPEVQITFDDGNASDIRYALPLLGRHGMKAIFFVIAARIGQTGFLSSSDIVELKRSGMGIGSHGMVHKPWRKMDVEATESEIYSAKARIEDLLGCEIYEAACPFGVYDRRSIAALKNAGFKTVYTSDKGATQSGAWLQARNTIHEADSIDSVLGLLDRSRFGLESLRIATKSMFKQWR